MGFIGFLIGSTLSVGYVCFLQFQQVFLYRNVFRRTGPQSNPPVLRFHFKLFTISPQFLMGFSCFPTGFVRFPPQIEEKKLFAPDSKYFPSLDTFSTRLGLRLDIPNFFHIFTFSRF